MVSNRKSLAPGGGGARADTSVDALTRAQVQRIDPEAAPFEAQHYHGHPHERLAQRLVALGRRQAQQHQRRRDQHDDGVQFGHGRLRQRAGVRQHRHRQAGRDGRRPADQPRHGHVYAVFYCVAPEHFGPVNRNGRGYETVQVPESRKEKKNDFQRNVPRDLSSQYGCPVIVVSQLSRCTRVRMPSCLHRKIAYETPSMYLEIRKSSTRRCARAWEKYVVV